MPTTINEAVESLSELQIQRSPVIQRPDTVDSQPAGGEPPRIHIIVPTELQPADEILSSQCPLDAQSPTSSREDSLEAEIPLAQQVKRNSMIHSTPSAPPTPAPGPSEPPSRGELHQPEPAPDIPLSEALRMVVAMRLQLDRQTQEERVDPVLRDNLSKVKSTPVPSHTSPEALVREVTSGERLISREATFETAKPSLQVRFALRQADLSDKVQRLKGEYLALHEQWRIHCGKLDDVARAMALQEAAATAGRTTRRSAATMGDAVRSDLEMEQIIASLGNEELTDANHLGARNAAVIPDMFTVSRGEIDYFFDDTNNEVQNPKEYYTPHTRMEDWTDEEISILVEKFAECPKQFGTIARSLPNKTAAECVAFYYLHKHKHIDFRKVVARKQASKRRRGGRKQKSNALLADILKRDDEVHATDGSNRRKRTSVVPGVELRRGPRRNVILADHTPTGTPTPEPEAESRKRKRRITVRTADSVEQDEVNEDVDMEPKAAKRGRRGRKPRNSSTPLSTPTISDDHLVIFAQEAKFVDQTEFSMRRKTAVGVTTWSNEDKATFLHLLSQHGDDFKRIAASMPNKTTIQVSTFYKANVVELGLEKIVAGAPKRSPSPDPSEMWRDAPFIGSGVITPSVSHSTTPGEGIPGLNNLSNFGPDSHVFPNGLLPREDYILLGVT
ncbi:hypothetical protein EW026_g8082 [Hermanssonia centrifuga]|uniref:SANT domain-containing protein n=1 Tax=Hermanssonia centrifuga TaxID=98765 RepID=A0A4S4K5M6_9APHY|nr:hypothetical protein EW026_g8082 [Hermanssonia centrifuga]